MSEMQSTRSESLGNDAIIAGLHAAGSMLLQTP